MRVLMVCLGNICRSPLAQGILEKKASDRGLNWNVDSCGTGFWHIGEAPDPRSVAVAKKNGIDISHQRARQFTADDYQDYDLIIPMDGQNLTDISKLNVKNHSAEVKLMMDFLFPHEHRPVPDPYYDGGFDHVYDLLNRATDKIIEKYG